MRSRKPSKVSSRGKKNVELDSWEDDVSDDEGSDSTGANAYSLSDGSWEQGAGEGALPQVLQAFRMLREEFEEKFRKVWA
ncbi:hypothetical protein NQ176_g6982 [Zarea fungicola]|uniref:Uncharacterized protein n=1 Tax=Zarea fungicola TaxID=93591 RepID=A0ACC1N0F8_9HYPO|nr:hypothetical protein NQ176_g6982 [Lecanicillium fungicola]